MLKTISILGFVGLALAAYTDDLVTTLPDMGDFTDFKLYSGYLSVKGTGKYLHYMFAESQGNPTTDPLLIWFNGGPGCSSMLGYLQEHGPFVIEDGATKFHKNDFSWNKETNMLYIESPAGVGYSYCDRKDICSFDDETSSNDNVDALLSFFEKFPEYRTQDLFISGESYAGVYVPYLAWRIDNYNTNAAKTKGTFQFNLKGFLVGNGVTNWKWDGDQSYVEMALYHGLYGLELKKQIDDNQCNFFYEDETPEDSPKCQDIYKQFGDLTSTINMYDIYRACYTNKPSQGFLMEEPTHGQVEINGEIKTYKRHYTNKDYTPWFYEKQAPKLEKYLGDLPPCTYVLPVIDWINRKDVRDALHVPDLVQSWEMCAGNDTVGYYSQPQASEWIYPLLKNKYRILFYSGDTDGAVPTRGSRQWIQNMGWTIKEQWRPYFTVDKQVAGYIEERDGLTFATIHGVGHMAPQWKRSETYHLIFNWIKGQPI